MQESSDEFEAFVDAGGRRWRVARAFADPLRRGLTGWVEADAPPERLAAGVVALKRSSRRDVFAFAPAGAPPLVLKRYPPRTGLFGRARDFVATRAFAEFRAARRLLERGLAVARPLAVVEPAAGRAGASAWLASTRIVGALPLGTLLEQHFAVGDRSAAKFALARRALDLLQAVHDAGFWHRDFHGGNLLLREAEGPAGTLHLIDLHAMWEIGSVPAALRARDAADFLHSLRYAFDDGEVAALAAEAPRWELEEPRLLAALRARRRVHARSRAARAFVPSSQFAQEPFDGGRVSRDRSLAADAIADLLARHAQACAGAIPGVLRIGARSRLSALALADGRRVVVKEFLGSGARRRARAAFQHAVAARARDLATAAPLACVRGLEDGRACFLAQEVAGAVPLHLAALDPERTAERRTVEAVARALLDFVERLVVRRFVHKDLSPKNLLVGAGADAPPAVVLVDLEDARPGRAWSRRRLEKALAQIGDVPERVFSRVDRLRWLGELCGRLGLDGSAGEWARATAARLRRRRKLLLQRLPAVADEPPRTLHVFGNWKWTGPADPAVALAQALAPGATLLLGKCPHPDLGQPVAEKAAARGVPFELLDSLHKHWNPLRTAAAAADVGARLQSIGPAVVHVHLDADHAAAARAADAATVRPALVRFVHEAGPHAGRSRRLFSHAAQLVLAPTRGLARALEGELKWRTGAVGTIETGVDLQRFRSDDGSRERGRARLGLGADDVVFGIVARIQSHRRWELLFEAWRELAELPRPPKLVVLGRGTRQEELAHEPVRRLGLQSLVLLPGYQEGAAYVDALAACDAGLFLVPGTDVSCRAVREWMAAGRSVLTTRRPPLPELVTDGVDGRLFDEVPQELARAVREWMEPGRLRDAGERALATARRRFDPLRVAAHAHAFDRMALLALPGMAASWRRAADVVAAVRPGSLPAVVDWIATERGDGDELAAFDPVRSRDAVIDLFALVAATGARRVVVDAGADWLDATVERELARRAIARIVVDAAEDGAGPN
jgi:glycosyltransferase involved in cell wall biosynthesis